MVRPSAFIEVGLLVVVAGCTESISAPGICPEFCPDAAIVMVDSLFPDAIERDTSFTGYLLRHQARAVHVARTPVFETRGLLRFNPYPSTIPVDSVNTGTVASLDSLRLDLVLDARRGGVGPLDVVLHRLPVAIDSSTEFGSADPWFADSTRIGVLVVPADAETGDTLRAVVPGDAFPTFDDDGRVVAVGLAMGSPDVFARFASAQAGSAPRMTRFARAVTEEGDTVGGQDSRPAGFDSYVASAEPTPGAAGMTVGGVPSSRAFLRVALPSFVIDESQIVTATLLLVPVEPVFGAPGDSVELVANAVGADFGPKSPVLPTVFLDSVPVRGFAHIGATDTVAINVTALLGQWQRSSRLPRTMVVRMTAEAATLAQLVVGTSEMPGFRPALRLTFIPPFSFVER